MISQQIQIVLKKRKHIQNVYITIDDLDAEFIFF